MNEYYETIYRKRLNRYGLDYQSRVQSQRERDFENYLYKTIYRVEFEINGRREPGSLERYKQDYSETQAYLLTRINTKIANGTILMIESQNGVITPWMVWWLERVETSGYNRYVVLKMTHELVWVVNGIEHRQWAYFRGPGTSTILDVIESSDGHPVYKENNNLHMFITSQNENINKEKYFEITQGTITQGYVVTEFDINSTPGVGYISVDPVPLRPKTERIEQNTEASSEDFYWLGGVN